MIFDYSSYCNIRRGLDTSHLGLNKLFFGFFWFFFLVFLNENFNTFHDWFLGVIVAVVVAVAAGRGTLIADVHHSSRSI